MQTCYNKKISEKDQWNDKLIDLVNALIYDFFIIRSGQI